MREERSDGVEGEEAEAERRRGRREGGHLGGVMWRVKS